MTPRGAGYCRSCDRAVVVRGAWPGRCAACARPIEPHPVADVVAPRLRLLLVGINPGVATARARVHFANPRNPFWRFLRESGLAPEAQPGCDPGMLLERGLGITNAVTRATPGSADITPEDVRRGRARLARLVADQRPERVAFVGKESYRMATGRRAATFGPQTEPAWGRPCFVLPSTSPANASVPLQEKLAAFRALAAWLARHG